MNRIELEFAKKEAELNQLIDEARNEHEESKESINMQSGVPSLLPSASARNIQQRILSAKKEVQKSKENAINESKMFLSKRVAEFEKEILKLQKHN